MKLVLAVATFAFIFTIVHGILQQGAPKPPALAPSSVQPGGH